jgi:GH15 family glucan-1,4-alpha-glucosidase
VKRKHGYAPIESYAAIGDGRTIALVAQDGAIDFLSLPTMYSPSTFGALLDAKRGGRFTLEPEGSYEVERRYLPRTNVLETTFRTKRGAVRVTDALTMHDGGLLPWIELARRIEGLEGEVALQWRVEPRFDWGRERPSFTIRQGVPVAGADDLEVAVQSWDAGGQALDDDGVGASFTATAGSRGLLVVSATSGQPIPLPERDGVERRLDDTGEVWRKWLGGWDWHGPWEEEVARSALALKLLVYAPKGAIAAAATTSLPERIGGDRNYDYRYFWVRDSAYTIDAFIRLGLTEQVQQSFTCLLESVQTTAPDLRPFYSLEGRPAERAEELDLPGYRGSRPVRYGNAAGDQLQIGTWGDLLETAELYVRHGHALDDGNAAMLAGCLDRLCLIWQDADSGIWETKERHRYTISAVGAWLAFDRGIRLAGEGQLPDDHLERWKRERDSVVAFVEQHCWSDAVGAYMEHADGDDTLDASLLRAARMGWGDVSPERLDRTIDTMRRELDAGGPLLYRTTSHVGQEGAFVSCSFWLAEALARRGRVDEAERQMEETLALRNDVGLYSEEIDPGSGAFLGNVPQGLSHLTMINAAAAILDARDGDSSATGDAAAR